MQKWGHNTTSSCILLPQCGGWIGQGLCLWLLFAVSLILPSIVMAGGNEFDGDIIFVSPETGDVSGTITIDVNTCDPDGIVYVKLGLVDPNGTNMGYMENTGGPGHGLSASPCGSAARTFRKVWDTRNVENGTYNFHAYACDNADSQACAVSPTPLTINVSNPVPPGRVRISFQDGVHPDADYTGTRDTKIGYLVSGDNYGASNDVAAGLGGSADEWKSILMKWNISAIPAGSIINFVRLKLATGNNASEDTFNAYKLKQSWVEGTRDGAACATGATWNKYNCASDWDSPGAEGTGDRYPQLIGRVYGLVANTTYSYLLNSYGVAAVQDWVNDPDSNYGIIIENRPDSTDAGHFHSRESATSSLRPKLTIEYTPVVYFTVSSGTVISDMGSEVIVGTDTKGYGHMQLVPLESQKMMAIYNDLKAGVYNLRYKIYDSGSWGSEQTLVTDCKDATTIIDRSIYHYFSAVADLNNAVHLIYVDSAGNPDVKYSSYTIAGGWSNPSLVQTGPASDPTLSYDLFNGDLYAFWIDGTSIKYSTKSATGGSWSASATTLRTNVYPPSYLGSALSDASSIDVIWRGGDSSAYEISYATVLLMPPAPNPPHIDYVYVSSITASWSLTDTATGYTLAVSTKSDSPPLIWASSTTVGINATTATVYSPALEANTIYYLFVRANGDGWSSNWSVYYSTSTLANPVVNPQIFKVFGTSMTVNWNTLPESPPATSSATCEGYIVIASSTDFNGTGHIRSSSTAQVMLSTLTVQNLWDETTYYFRVGSLNWNNMPNFVFVSSACTLPDSGDGTGFAAFDTASNAEQVSTNSGDKTLTITGNGQKALTAASIEIPYTWSWTGNAGDVAISGAGITDPNDKHVTGLGTDGDPYIITLGTNTAAAITNISSGVVAISNLTALGTAGASSDNIFTVKTKCTGGLAEIVSSPGIAVYGTLTLGTDSTWNPSGEVLIESDECLIAAFTLSANEEDVTIKNFTVKFTALGGASLGTEIISFRIYKESEDTANGWDDRGYPTGDDQVLKSGAAEFIDGAFEMYIANQNDSLTVGESPHTYYLTVNVSGEIELQEGVKVDIAASTIIVSGAVSQWNFTNAGTFAGNNIYKGGGAAEAGARVGPDRQTFYDGSEYWMFYIDGEESKVWFKTSPDGSDWTGDRTQVNDSATNLTLLGIGEDNQFIYVTYTDGINSYVRKITISDKSMGDEYTITSVADIYSQIGVDSGGKLWRKSAER